MVLASSFRTFHAPEEPKSPGGSKSQIDSKVALLSCTKYDSEVHVLEYLTHAVTCFIYKGDSCLKFHETSLVYRLML